MALPSVSVVVATFNRADRLRRLIESLARQTYPGPLEIVIVNDGSSDSTAEVLAAAPIELLVLDGVGSGGPAKARNLGWRAASGELIGFTDDDCEPTTQWVERAVSRWQRRSDRIVQGPTLPNPADPRSPLCRSKTISAASSFFQTCNIFYPAAALDLLDGFDESFGSPFGEDVDLGLRARRLGCELVFEPAALVHHAVEPRSWRELLREAGRAADAGVLLRHHPDLRPEMSWCHFFQNRAHARLILALIGLGLAPRQPLAALAALPYAKGLRGRSRELDAWPQAVPLLAAHDLIEIKTALEIARRERILII